MDDALIEEIAEHVYHDVWKGNFPGLEPYASAPAYLKQDARDVARAALTGIERAGYIVSKRLTYHLTDTSPAT